MAEPERQLESARRESLDRVAEATMAWVEGQRAAEQATAVEWGLKAVKARQTETEAELRTSLADIEVVLQKSLVTLELERSALASERNALELARKALESERKARSEVDREVLALRGWVMGTEEANVRLREQAARQVEGLSALEDFCLGTYLSYFSSCWFLTLACF